MKKVCLAVILLSMIILVVSCSSENSIKQTESEIKEYDLPGEMRIEDIAVDSSSNIYVCCADRLSDYNEYDWISVSVFEPKEEVTTQKIFKVIYIICFLSGLTYEGLQFRIELR